ncbi:MAG: CsbD family protein [Desulfobacterales bacterium]
MNKDIIKGKWNQIKGEVKKQWGDLTNDELDEIEGNYDKMIGKLQEKYGYNRERAEKEADAFFTRHR